MKIKIVSSCTEGNVQKHYAVSVIINDTVCIDAGCLGFMGEPADQERIEHLFITHTHIDHTASLPIFLENVYTAAPQCVKIYASDAVHDGLQRDMFNDRLWPDFVGLSTPENPFLERVWLEPEVPVAVAGIRVTPVEVNHGVPTFGYIIEDEHSAICFSSDTAATERLWEIARATRNMKAVFLDCSFPNRLRSLAELSFHLVPEQFQIELAKAPPGCAVYPMTIKTRFREETVAELEALGIAGLAFAPTGEVFEV